MDIPSWAVSGAKVVCIKDFSPKGMKPIKAGTTYTIREVRVAIMLNAVGLMLNEVVNAPNPTFDMGMIEQSYVVTVFAPLVDTKMEQDIAMFKDILLHAHEYRDVTENA